jgi:transposase
VITDEVYVEIEVLKRQGLSLRQIASEAGCSVNTVRAHLAAPGLPRYERKVKRVTKLAPFEAYLVERQAAAHPNWIPATAPAASQALISRSVIGRCCLLMSHRLL